ncbi:MAG: hypothetical protein AVDCRST_MAG89-5080, partial [uncultured Gemmatimonadetes bacterium]
ADDGDDRSGTSGGRLCAFGGAGGARQGDGVDGAGDQRLRFRLPALRRGGAAGAVRAVRGGHGEVRLSGAPGGAHRPGADRRHAAVRGPPHGRARRHPADRVPGWRYGLARAHGRPVLSLRRHVRRPRLGGAVPARAAAARAGPAARTGAASAL